VRRFPSIIECTLGLTAALKVPDFTRNESDLLIFGGQHEYVYRVIFILQQFHTKTFSNKMLFLTFLEKLTICLNLEVSCFYLEYLLDILFFF
jgi:hypothetical protein